MQTPAPSTYRVYQHLARFGPSTRGKLVQSLGLKIRTVEYAIQQLRKAGQVKIIGNAAQGFLYAAEI